VSSLIVHFDLHASVKQVHVAEEIRHERRRWPLNDLAGCGILLDLSLVHDDDAVGELERLFLIVRHEDAGEMNFLMQAAEPAPQLLPNLGVERAERLVEQKHRRLDGERARQRDSLALAA
jgi:hypothetical protein